MKEIKDDFTNRCKNEIKIITKKYEFESALQFAKKSIFLH